MIQTFHIIPCLLLTRGCLPPSNCTVHLSSVSEQSKCLKGRFIVIIVNASLDVLIKVNIKPFNFKDLSNHLLPLIYNLHAVSLSAPPTL